MFERPAILFLLVVAPLVAVPGILAIRRGRMAAGALAVAIRVSLLAVLVVMAAGLRTRRRAAARRMAVVVAVDRSRSIAPDQMQWMARRVEELAGAMGRRDELAVLSFGRDVRLIAPLADARLVGPVAARALGGERGGAESGATDIAAAMTAALGLFPARAEKRLVLLSDGLETQGSALAELPAMTEQGVRIFAAAPPPSAIGRVALTEFAAPDPVRADESFGFRIAIENQASEPVRALLKLEEEGKPLGAQTLTLRPGSNRFELPYRIARAGAYLVDADLDAPAPVLTVNARAEAAVSVIGPPRVLVISTDPPMSVLSALKMRHIPVDRASPRGLPERAEDYLAYQAVIIADAPAGALSAGAQQALNRYVADLGGGLIVTGEALREEKFKGGALERALPIRFKPQPPPPAREPIAVYLCIDRSNSMSYNSRYPAVRDGERIRYAKQAAIALLRQLDDSDYAGVIAFDSQPYILARLHPLGEDRDELERRIERLEPGGGTDFKEALEIAEKEILASGIAVRQVILLTDGDTNRQYHDHDALIADYAAHHIPVSTIRIGPDLANLRLLQDFAQATGGVFYRVEDIEKLPQLLVRLTRRAMDREKHGRTMIEYQGPSAILSGINPREIPRLEMAAATEAKPEAQVPLRLRRGEKSIPLLATWQYGLGRSVVFTADPDSLASLSWIRWNRYAEFWSQVVNWAARPGESGPFNLRIEPMARTGVSIVAEKADSSPAGNLVCRITGPGRAFDLAMTPVGGALYRGESGALARGVYTATLMRKAGDIEQAIVSRQFAVAAPPAADAAELRLRAPDRELLRRLATESGGELDAPVATVLKRRGASVVVYTSATPYLIPIAIALMLAEVFVRRRVLGT